jgi:hypothetical protein
MLWNRRRLSEAKSKHLRGLARAGGYVAGLSLLLGAVQLRAAHAEVRNRTVELGRQMLQLAKATDHDVNKLTLNGQAMWLGSSQSRDSVSDILDRYQAECAKNGAQPPESWRELVAKNDANNEKNAPKAGLASGTLRGGDRDEGTVLCFTKGEGSKPTVKEALTSLAQTGELGALGNLRYVYAKKTDPGATVVLTAWTDEKFNLIQLVPPEGTEATGSDFPDLPRPPTSTRLMAAQVEGTPFGVNVYRSKQGPSKVVAFYDEEMVKRGWFALDPELAKQSPTGESPSQAIGRLYERDGVVLTLASNLQDGDTVTGLGLAGVTSTDGTRTETGMKTEGANAKRASKNDKP